MYITHHFKYGTIYKNTDYSLNVCINGCVPFEIPSLKITPNNDF